MSIRSKQILTGVLALTGMYAGVWAATWPRQFYDSFPGMGRHWVSVMGPYDEHLVRDVGGLYMAMAVISLWAVVRTRNETFAMVGLGWLAFNIPHFIYHVRMLAMVPERIDKVGNVVTLAAVLIFAALLVLPTRQTRPVLTTSSLD